MIFRSRKHKNWFQKPAVSHGLWALLLLMHVPAMVTSGTHLFQDVTDPATWASFALLSVTNIFFMLKIRGVRFLQFNTSQSSVAIIIAAVVLIHANAVGTRLDWSGGPDGLPIAASVLLATGLTRVQDVMCGDGPPQHRVGERLLPATDTVRAGSFAPRRWTLIAHQCVPRSPPA